MTSSASARVLERLHATGDPWGAFDREDWPELFSVLAVAADLPRLAGHRALSSLPKGLWPELAALADDVTLLQRMVDEPGVPPATRWPACLRSADLAAAREELEKTHCVTVDFLFDGTQQRGLDAQIEALSEEHAERWGQLERDQAPELFRQVDEGLGSERFRDLTGFELGRDPYTLTLSLQSLQPTGIGWHRDLYWPEEWVGQDVFAVLYALGDDSAAKGGAFLYYVPWHNEILGCYRKRHQATILWNSADPEGRILHAVSGYPTADTSRHLVILQCLRRGGLRRGGLRRSTAS